MLLTNIHPLPRQRAAATVAAAVEAAAPVAVAATAVAVAAAGGAAVRAAAAQGVVVCDAKTTLCSFLTRWATRRLTELSRRSLRGSRSMAVVEPGERMRCATMAQLGWGGGGGLAAKRQSLDRRLVSHAELLAELEEKQAKFAEEVEKAGLQEKLDAKKIKRLSDSAESLKREVGKVKEKDKAPAAIEAAARRGAAKPGQTTKKLRSLEATTASGEKAAIQKLYSTVDCYNCPPCFKERTAADYLCAGVVVVASRAGMALAALGILLNPPTPKCEVDYTKRAARALSPNIGLPRNFPCYYSGHPHALFPRHTAHS